MTNEKLVNQHLEAISKNTDPYDGMAYEQSAATSCAAITVEHMKGFSEWLQENRWFTFDRQKQVWYYSFEHGTSMSDSDYLKNYTKTTDELVNLYFKSIQ